VGKLLDIAIRERSRAPMQRCDSISISRDAGLEGDFRGRARDRNVTVLGREGWQAACADLGSEVAWTTRRANLLVEGLELEHSTGARLEIGEVALEITGECDPCARMEEQVAGLRGALEPNWRAGVQCRVLEPGRIQVGDRASLAKRPA
jgi:MOSC domain-containing protein YiiM